MRVRRNFKRGREKFLRSECLVQMDLATIKEENQLAPTALISQVFAPRYMTRSRVVSESDVRDEQSSNNQASEPTLVESSEKLESAPPTPSEWETSSDTQAPSSEAAGVETPSVQGTRVAASGSASSSRKRGRHKEYTAPTGVWKTNGGYISTIYVGNRRIYGPLRDNPEEAGMDRQKLLEAKAFAKTEAEMRNYIATLKSGEVSKTPAPRRAAVEPPAASEPSANKRRRPQLSTITSSLTTIEAVAESEQHDVLADPAT